MKKISTLFVALCAMASAVAQNHGSMNFIGNSTFTATLFNASQSTVKDTVIVGDCNTSVTLPAMTYNGLTIPAIKYVNLAYTMTGSYMTGDMAFVWTKQYADTTITLADNTTKELKNVSLTVTYTHTSGQLDVDATFTYGSMPSPIHYVQTGFYTQDSNEWNLVGRGTAANPYRIFEAADFKSLADNISATNKGTGQYFIVMNDIDFGGNAETPAQLPSIGKAAIANITNVAWGFNGTLDGNGKSISGIYHTENTNSDAGKFNALFSSLDTLGVIKDLTFTDNNSINSYNYAAPFACMSKGIISGCTNKANVTAANTFAAGICGYLVSGLGTIDGCKNYGNVSAQTYATGIVSGSQYAKTITELNYAVSNCENYGAMTCSKGSGAAGIVGSYSGAVTNCTNHGTIGTADLGTGIGGIASAVMYNAKVEGCTNNGAVAGQKQVAGIVGNLMKGEDTDVTVSGCTNNGAVSGTANVAGIVGNSARTNGIVTLADCANEGVVTAPEGCETAGNLRGSSNIVIGEGCTINATLQKLYLDDTTSAIESVSEVTANAPAYDLNGRRTNGNGLTISGAKVRIVK